MSFHDFELAIGPVGNLRIRGEWDHRRRAHEDWARGWEGTLDGRYQALLQEMVPRMPRPWLEPELAFVLWKP